MDAHAHVIDPTWSGQPISWAPETDATLLPRVHAACLDECEDCLYQIEVEAAQDPASTAIIVGMAFAMLSSIPAPMLPMIKDSVPFGAPLWLLLERIAAAGDRTNGPEVKAMVGEMDTGDRREIVKGCIGVMTRYTAVMREKEQPSDPR